jgi:hypothetical protein
MSGFPSFVSVVRYVPEHLLAGYESGALRLWGGAFRHQNGRFAGYLTEGFELTQHVQKGLPIDPARLMQTVGNAQMAAQLATGIGILNLGVQVAGFAIIAHRIDRIAGRIEAVHDELRSVGEGVDWLKLSAFAGLRADVAHAIDVAERASRRQAHALYDEAKSKADRCRRYLMNLVGEMTKSSTLLPQHPLYEEFVNLTVLLTDVEARCDEACEGAGQAAKNLARSASELRRLTNSFSERVHNFRGSPRQLLRIGGEGRADIKAAASRVGGVVGRLESYVPQLELQDILGLDAKDWRALTSPEGGGPLSCISFAEPSDRDLVEAVRASQVTPRPPAQSTP